MFSLNILTAPDNWWLLPYNQHEQKETTALSLEICGLKLNAKNIENLTKYSKHFWCICFPSIVEIQLILSYYI